MRTHPLPKIVSIPEAKRLLVTRRRTGRWTPQKEQRGAEVLRLAITELEAHRKSAGNNVATFYLDTEFNGFDGELISIALVSEDGDEFYEVVPFGEPTEWVAAHVVPLLDKPPVSKDPATARLCLAVMIGAFLHRYDAVHIVADWPADLMHFAASLIAGEGRRMSTPPITMELRTDLGSVTNLSEIPHNALSDARALMRLATAAARKKKKKAPAQEPAGAGKKAPGQKIIQRNFAILEAYVLGATSVLDIGRKHGISGKRVQALANRMLSALSKNPTLKHMGDLSTLSRGDLHSSAQLLLEAALTGRQHLAD